MTKEIKRFTASPPELFQDRRLTKIQLRVMLCLFNHHNMRTCAPVRLKAVTISKETGIFLNKVRVATSELVELGWLVKVGQGGKGRANQYYLNWDWPESALSEMGYTSPNSGLLSRTKPRGQRSPD